MISTWLQHHRLALTTSLGQLSTAPLTSLVIFLVVGIALALPVGFYVLLTNLQHLGDQWDKGTQVSLYLKQSVSEQQGETLARKLQFKQGIESARYISPTQGLQFFKQVSGVESVVDALNNNPLPGVVVIEPTQALSEPFQLHALVKELEVLPAVDTARLDMAWIKRLHHFLNLGHMFMVALGSFLGLAVVLIIGSTIRMAVQQFRQQITVFRQVGATDRFIRRPFLYTGAVYGVSGSIIACLLVDGFMSLLNQPVLNLARQYGSVYQLQGLDSQQIFSLILVSVLMAWVVTWGVVRQQLRRF